MADLYHTFGQDLLAGPTIEAGIVDPLGDLLTVGAGSPAGDIPTATVQRLLRRLLTNPGDYLWDLNYGAGLGRYLGQPTSKRVLTAVIRSQMALEDAVSQTPAPQITLTTRKDGSVFCNILYTDAATGKPTPLSFTIPE